MIEAQLMKDGGVEVVNMDFVLHRIETKIIGFSIINPTFNPSAGEPHCKGIGVVVTPIRATLSHWGAAELSAKNDESVFKHTALLKIFNESCARLVDVFAILFEPSDKAAMLIP